MPLSLQVFIVIFVIGAFIRSRAVLTKVHTERLSAFVFSVSLPATILVSLDQVPLAPTAWKLPLAACFITLPMVVCSSLGAGLHPHGEIIGLSPASLAAWAP